MTTSIHDRPMKDYHNRIITLVSCILLSMTLYGASPDENEQLFYYTFNNKVPIEAVPGRFMLKKQQNIEMGEFENLVKDRVGEVQFDWFNSDICTVFACDTFVDDAIALMLAEDAIVSARPVYMITSDKEYFHKHHILQEPLTLGFVDLVVLKYKDNVDESVRDEIQKKFGLKKYTLKKNYELFAVSKTDDILSLSNRLYETGYFEFAYPELITRVTLCDNNAVFPNDPYFQYQVTLHNTGQAFNGHTGTPNADIDAPEAWALTMGSEDIVIAVIDLGVTSNHPDLPNTRQLRLNGSNFGAGDPDDPSPLGNDNHGNACAGVIAATSNNGKGVAGIAPLCKIMPIRIDYSSSPEDIADAIDFAVENGANIISNSWIYPSESNDVNSAIIRAIENAIENNVLVIFAAGNNANHSLGEEYKGFVEYPANRNLSGMLTVGASDRYDYQADYSPTDSCIDIVAPSHRAYPFNPDYYNGIIGENLDMWTIDIPGDSGCNKWHSDQGDYFSVNSYLPFSETGTEFKDYTGRFGGTSHSCPVVAGVAALVLSVNPNLTPQTVCNVLTNTAEKVGGYAYNNGRCDEMGYGRVNAKDAVWMVCDTTFYDNQVLYNNVQPVTGCDIYMKDDYIYDATLRVRYRNRVTIEGEFYIDNGTLDIRHY